MATLGIDHLVIAVTDPDAAAAGLEAELGLAFTGGGRHEQAGTWNRLAFLGDAYIELIGVFDRSLAVASGDSFPVGRAALSLLDAGREGLATWAVAVDDCAATVARLRRRDLGSPLGDPMPGSRVRPDGETVRWVTAFPPVLSAASPPFLIEHEPVGAEWGAEALAARRAFRHPVLGKARVGRLVLPLDDPAAYAAECEDAVGLHFRPDVSGWTGYAGFDTVHLHPTATGLPVIQIDAPGSEAGRRSLVRHGVDWFVSPD